MANEALVKLLEKGADAWNKWKQENNLTNADLSEAKLSNINLSKADLRYANLYKADLSNTFLTGAELAHANLAGANLSNAVLLQAMLTMADLSGAELRYTSLAECNGFMTNLSGANLFGAYLGNSGFQGASFSNASLLRANLSKANLRGCDFSNAKLFDCDISQADLTEANFSNADLTEANLSGSYFYKTNLTNANLSNANLQKTILVETIIDRATLRNSFIYGLSAWNLSGVPSDQSALTITPVEYVENRNILIPKTKIIKHREEAVLVDDLLVAQFVYMLLNRENLRKVIDTITSKAVLILGRFTPERKKILDAISGEVRKHQLLPIIFDFDRPASRDFTETIKTLAGISFFIIADISNPKSSPLELQATVPDFQIPFVPIIQEGERPFSMFSDLSSKYNWVLQPVITYSSADNLSAAFKPAILDRAWQKHQQLQKQKITTIETQSIEEFLTSRHPKS